MSRHRRRIMPVGGVCLLSTSYPLNGGTQSGKVVHESLSSISFGGTPLGQNGAHLLDGLEVYSVPSSEDNHPLAVYGIESQNPVQFEDNKSLRPILLLHGRTWSSVPVYHLFGGPKHRELGDESRSLMEALLSHGLQPYCMDFRGFGGTAMDHTGFVEPLRCVQDAETVLEWISQRHGHRHTSFDKRHGNADVSSEPPTLLGWSQGALVAQLLAQKNISAVSKLILYGSIYDPLVRYPREPLYQMNRPNRTVMENKFDEAIEDFTVEGTIPPEPARWFAQAALISDPIKAVWRSNYQFNNCDPARVHIPTLVVAGDQDPYAPLHVQQELFANLGRGSDRTWCILADSDHAVHLLEGRARLINTIVSFCKNDKRTEQRPYY
jgi:pimeloyl-ACP methyl ester carboxylesterase